MRRDGVDEGIDMKTYGKKKKKKKKSKFFFFYPSPGVSVGITADLAKYNLYTSIDIPSGFFCLTTTLGCFGSYKKKRFYRIF